MTPGSTLSLTRIPEFLHPLLQSGVDGFGSKGIHLRDWMGYSGDVSHIPKGYVHREKHKYRLYVTTSKEERAWIYRKVEEMHEVLHTRGLWHNEPGKRMQWWDRDVLQPGLPKTFAELLGLVSYGTENIQRAESILREKFGDRVYWLPVTTSALGVERDPYYDDHSRLLFPEGWEAMPDALTRISVSARMKEHPLGPARYMASNPLRSTWETLCSLPIPVVLKRMMNGELLAMVDRGNV